MKNVAGKVAFVTGGASGIGLGIAGAFVDAGMKVVTADLRLNEPRYIKLPDIMKAKKKPLEVIELAALNVDPAPALKVVKLESPPQRQKGVIVKDAAELVAALKQKGLV